MLSGRKIVTAKIWQTLITPAISGLFILACSCGRTRDSRLSEAAGDWPVYLGGKTSSHYSPLSQVNRQNVTRLKVAWQYHSGLDEVENLSQIQCNPLVINGVLYGTSPRLKVFAVDASTGKEIWKFNPDINNDFAVHPNRGLAYWEDGEDKRLLFGAGSNLYAINAATGTLIATFGNDGIVSLREGLGDRAKESYVVLRTPGIIYKDLIIVGSSLSETMGAAPGHIRAFNVRTGKLVWVFHTIPQPGEPGNETWPVNAFKYHGGANCWAGMSLDEKRGIVYCPTGSAVYDFWGGNRKGTNLYANCLIALNAETGERIWHFQTVHHDIFDKDLPAPPNLITVTHNGRRTAAVAQVTKQGYIFLFDRENGNPLFTVNETPVPESGLEGEEAWPTQPVPSTPPPLVPQIFTAADATDISQSSHDSVTSMLGKVSTGNIFMPPSAGGTIIFPGFDGGAEWGGAAAEPDKGILYVNCNIMPWISRMIPVDYSKQKNVQSGMTDYIVNCGTCHGQNMEGNNSGTFPSLRNLRSGHKVDEIKDIITRGKGFMPSFRHLGSSRIDAIVAYITDDRKYQLITPEASGDTNYIVPFAHDGYNRFFDKDGYPAIRPPWGTLSAVDLNAGKILWQVPLGEYRELTERGIPKTGTENYGGPVVTAGGLIFIGASKDENFRVFDKDTGEEIWKYRLPAGGYATPCTYMVNGKQYIVIACGGGKMGTSSGDSYVAFALEQIR